MSQGILALLCALVRRVLKGTVSESRIFYLNAAAEVQW